MTCQTRAVDTSTPAPCSQSFTQCFTLYVSPASRTQVIQRGDELNPLLERIRVKQDGQRDAAVLTLAAGIDGWIIGYSLLFP